MNVEVTIDEAWPLKGGIPPMEARAARIIEIQKETRRIKREDIFCRLLVGLVIIIVILVAIFL